MSEETKTEQPTTNTNEGNQPSTISIVERIDSSIKRLEDVENRVNTKMQQYEQLIARSLISGRSDAGTAVKLETPEEKAKREAMEFLKGTGLNPFK